MVIAAGRAAAIFAAFNIKDSQELPGTFCHCRFTCVGVTAVASRFSSAGGIVIALSTVDGFAEPLPLTAVTRN